MRRGTFGFPPLELVSPPSTGDVQFSPFFPGGQDISLVDPGTFDEFTLLAPPGTVERRYTLALALRALRPGGSFLALAPKDKGGSRIKKELTAFGCEVEEEAKHHHRLCRGIRPESPFIEEALAEGSARKDEALGLWTQPGVFSWDRTDRGSRLLLSHLPAMKGEAVDLGAGLGVLSLKVLASPSVTRLHLVELDRRALDCARKNVTDPRAIFHWLDVRGALPWRNLPFVVTNPPFHEVGQEDRDLGLAFLRRAAEILAPGGEAWIVANRHLPYETTLAEKFSRQETIAEEDGFKVIRAIR